MIINQWAWEAPVSQACRHAKVDKQTAIDMYQWLREVSSTMLLPMPIVLGGPGIEVHVDESLFHHKPKVLVINFNYNHSVDYSYIESQRTSNHSTSWVLGIADTSCTPSLGYMQLVENRTATTLLHIIRRHTARESIVHTGEWRAYNGIQRLHGLCLEHCTVNHSLHFVDPTTRVHTQNIESYWNLVKIKLKHMRGCHSHQLPSYLDKFMWKESHGQTEEQAYTNIIRDISIQYPL